MDESVTRALAGWSGFYTLLGGAAATLLGLLFVALSLRLNVFRDQALADVRDFATFTFSTFLVALVIAALALAPHARGSVLAVALGLVGAVGLLMTVWVARQWRRLNRALPRPPRCA
jgi:O-antigen/teichoic acid export membrane protein